MRSRAVLATVCALGAAAISGTGDADPHTPPPAPGLAAPFLGVAVLGQGGPAAAVDAYGDVVDLRWPGPAGEAEIHNPSDRQRFGTVEPGTGITVAAGAGGRLKASWAGDEYRQAYLGNSNVLVTRMTLGGARVRFEDAIGPRSGALVRRIQVTGPGAVGLRLGLNFDIGGDESGDSLHLHGASLQQSDGPTRMRCRFDPVPQSRLLTGGEDARAVVRWRARGKLEVGLSCSLGQALPDVLGALHAARRAGHHWLRRARPLGTDAPAWAVRLYRRSLRVLQALTDRATGASVAGARDGWAFVWPRDAATAELALRASGYNGLARRIASFLVGLDPGAAPRFGAHGSPLSNGHGLAGDEAGWIGIAAHDAGMASPRPQAWRGRHDYAEHQSGDFLANAIASGVPSSAIRSRFGRAGGLMRWAGASGALDSAAAWAIEPFHRPGIKALARRTLDRLAAGAGQFGIQPRQDWPGLDPWTAPTAWSAWALARIGDHRAGDRLLFALRQAATPAGLLPERLAFNGGIPRSTTPLAWSHAMAILALRARWPRQCQDCRPR